MEMLGRFLLGLIAAAGAAPFFLPMPARAEIINLSCDNGGMLLVIDTGHNTVTDKSVPADPSGRASHHDGGCFRLARRRRR